MMTPSRVRKLRSLCERMESIASQNAFLKLMPGAGKPRPDWAICIQDNVMMEVRHHRCLFCASPTPRNS